MIYFIIIAALAAVGYGVYYWWVNRITDHTLADFIEREERKYHKRNRKEM